MFIYSIYNVGPYTLAPFKVVWTRVANIEAAVVSEKNNKPIIPQETITLVALNNEQEAHYLCAMINSSPFQYACLSYSQAGGKSMGSPHVLENIRIPTFDQKNKFHIHLADLSIKAHQVTKTENKEKLKDVEEEIDQISAQIWGLTKEELKEIKLCLEELR